VEWAAVGQFGDESEWSKSSHWFAGTNAAQRDGFMSRSR
jgi:hypothetical protein